jgi:hypothetical protein
VFVVGRFIDMEGKTFGKLTAIKRVANKGKYVMWHCKCDCGEEVVLPGIQLRHGRTKSCGCLRKTLARENQTRHGMSTTRFYRIWKAMINRCANPNTVNYDLYGGKGVSVCKDWKDFINFKRDMYESYVDHSQIHGEGNTSIDRIDVDGDYTLSNCRWATNQVQSRNTSSKSGHKGVQRSSDGKKWVANIGINYQHIYLGIFDNLEDAITARKEAEKIYWR